MKIFLIGFMGAGKTTHGRALATLLQFDFIDLDKLIESKLQKSIPGIFKDEGEDFFRKQEALLLRSVKDQENLVVSVGGGAPCYSDNMDWMNNNGRTVYIQMNPKALLYRIWNSKTERPLIQGKSIDETETYIENTLKRREDFYLKAQSIIEGRDLRTNDLLDFLNLEI